MRQLQFGHRKHTEALPGFRVNLQAVYIPCFSVIYKEAIACMAGWWHLPRIYPRARHLQHKGARICGACSSAHARATGSFSRPSDEALVMKLRDGNAWEFVVLLSYHHSVVADCWHEQLKTMHGDLGRQHWFLKRLMMMMPSAFGGTWVSAASVSSRRCTTTAYAARRIAARLGSAGSCRGEAGGAWLQGCGQVGWFGADVAVSHILHSDPDDAKFAVAKTWQRFFRPAAVSPPKQTLNRLSPSSPPSGCLKLWELPRQTRAPALDWLTSIDVKYPA